MRACNTVCAAVFSDPGGCFSSQRTQTWTFRTGMLPQLSSWVPSGTCFIPRRVLSLPTRLGERQTPAAAMGEGPIQF